MSPPVIFAVMAILCFLVACGVTIRAGVFGAEGATKWSQVVGAWTGALMFGALAAYTWLPKTEPGPPSDQRQSPQPAISPASPPILAEPAGPQQASIEALTLAPAGSWFAGVKYRDELQFPTYLFTYHLMFDAAGQLQPLLSWCTDGAEGANAPRRPIKSGRLSGNRLSLEYDSPKGVAITLDAKLAAKQGRVYLFDTTLAAARADPSLAPSQRVTTVNVALYLEHEA